MPHTPQRDAGPGPRDLPPPDARTGYPPGSPGKVAVMAARHADGVSLWHPDDVTGPAILRPAGDRPGIAFTDPAVRAVLRAALRDGTPPPAVAARLRCSTPYARALLDRMRAGLSAG